MFSQMYVVYVVCNPGKKPEEKIRKIHEIDAKKAKKNAPENTFWFRFFTEENKNTRKYQTGKYFLGGKVWLPEYLRKHNQDKKLIKKVEGYFALVCYEKEFWEIFDINNDSI